MKCEKCGRELRLWREEVVETQYHTDDDGNQAGWIEDVYGEELRKWYKCGCEVCPYVPTLRDDGDGGIVAKLRE